MTKDRTPDEQELKIREENFEAAKTALLGVHGKIKKEPMETGLILERLRLKPGWGEAACKTGKGGCR